MSEEGKEQPPAQTPPHGEAHKTSVWEWIVAGIGLIVVAGMIGFMVYQAIWGDASPPDVEVRLVSVTPVTGGYLAGIVAVNRGGATAAMLLLEGQLKDGDETLETSEATLAFLPGGSQREAGLFFANDPRSFELQLRAKGFQAP